MTQQATLNVKYVNQPKPGKTLGSIKDDQGVLWLCEPGLLGSFRPGTKATVEHDILKMRDGTELKKITGVVHGTSNGAAEPEHATDKDRLIFITGVVGRAMGSGKFAIAEMTALTGAALMAWELVLGAGTLAVKAPTHDGPNDSVPF